MPNRIYLDHHATTPCDPQVIDAMLPYFGEMFGNAASRSHGFGRAAKEATEQARSQVASLLGGSPKEIVWTSGATEANNLAILGAARVRGSGHIVTSCIEHRAVLDPVLQLEQEGFTATRVGVGADGLVAVDAIAAALRPDTILVSLMLANNEIGTLQPVAEVARLCSERGILVHTDAAQAVGKLPVDVRSLGVDLLSLTAHKLYGPKGIGALWVRRGRPKVELLPLQFGGGHERGLRSGTLPVPLTVGFGVACSLCEAELATDALSGVRALRDQLLHGLLEIGGVEVNGTLTERLPNNLNVSIARVEAEALMMSMREIAVSTGSACSSATLEPSYVLRALGIGDERAHHSIRFGLGRFTSAEEIRYTVDKVREKVDVLRSLDEVDEPGRGRDATRH